MKQWMLISLIVLGVAALLIILILIPLTFRLMGHLDLLHNHLFFAVRVLGIKAFSGSIRAHGNRIYLMSGKGKETVLKIFAPPTDEEAISSYISPNLPQITMKKLNLYMQLGKSDDAFFSAMMLGIFQSLLFSGMSMMKTKYPKMELDHEFKVLYNYDHLQMTFNCILTMSIADIIYAIYEVFTYHKKMTKGEKENGRKNKRVQQRTSD